jgi:GNAT superfamily N-acetyltransferase
MAPYQLYTGQMTAAEVAERFGGLIAARFRRHLADGRVAADRRLLTAGAMHRDRPVGLALAPLPSVDKPAVVDSLGVVPEHRNHGLGTALLALLEENVKQKGTSRIQAAYRSDLDHVAALERVFAKQHWDAPQAVRRLYRAHTKDVLRAPLMDADPLPSGFEFFDWDTLSPAERSAIRQRQDSTHPAAHPEALDPFQLSDRITAACSVGVRHEDDVAGWMVVHRLHDDLMQYTSLFVRPTFWRPRIARALLAEAVQRQIDRTDATRGVWMVDLSNAPMLRFIDRCLSTQIATRADLLLAGKRLNR